MRSESLRRLHVEQPHQTGNETARAEIQSHIAEYLSRGGKITQLESFKATVHEDRAVVDSISGSVVSLPRREVVDGVVLLTVHAVASMVSLSVTNVRVRSNEGRFPKPVITKPQWRWDEADIEAWLEQQL